MRDQLSDPETGHGRADPVKAAQEAMRTPLPRRFYKTAGVAPEGDGHAVQLDGRTAKTPGRAPFVLATEAAAQMVADEFAAQGETIGADSPGQSSTTEKDPETWVTGDEPMTGAQRSYLDTLAREAGTHQLAQHIGAGLGEQHAVRQVHHHGRPRADRGGVLRGGGRPFRPAGDDDARGL